MLIKEMQRSANQRAKSISIPTIKKL